MASEKYEPPYDSNIKGPIIYKISTKFQLTLPGEVDDNPWPVKKINHHRIATLKAREFIKSA